MGEMAVGKFLAFTAIGCALFTTALTLLGYSLGSTWASVEKKFSYAGYVVAILFVILLAVVIYHRVRTMREEREAAGGAR